MHKHIKALYDDSTISLGKTGDELELENNLKKLFMIYNHNKVYPEQVLY